MSNYKKTNGISEKYSKRPVGLDEISLFDFSKFYEVRGSTYSKRYNPAVVRLFPKVIYQEDKEISKIELDAFYCFFIPWRTDDDLKVPLEKKIHDVGCRGKYIERCLQCTLKKRVKDFISEEEDSVDDNLEVGLDEISAYNPTKNLF